MSSLNSIAAVESGQKRVHSRIVRFLNSLGANGVVFVKPFENSQKIELFFVEKGVRIVGRSRVFILPEMLSCIYDFSDIASRRSFDYARLLERYLSADSQVVLFTHLPSQGDPQEELRKLAGVGHPFDAESSSFRGRLWQERKNGGAFASHAWLDGAVAESGSSLTVLEKNMIANGLHVPDDSTELLRHLNAIGVRRLQAGLFT